MPAVVLKTCKLLEWLLKAEHLIYAQVCCMYFYYADQRFTNIWCSLIGRLCNDGVWSGANRLEQLISRTNCEIHSRPHNVPKFPSTTYRFSFWVVFLHFTLSIHEPYSWRRDQCNSQIYGLNLLGVLQLNFFEIRYDLWCYMEPLYLVPLLFPSHWSAFEPFSFRVSLTCSTYYIGAIRAPAYHFLSTFPWRAQLITLAQYLHVLHLCFGVNYLVCSRFETFPKVFFLMQVVYKSEPAWSDNYIL